MHLSSVTRILWAAGFLGHVALLFILCIRHRLRTFPFFSAYIAYQILTTVVLFVDYEYMNAAHYALFYWSAAVIDFCLLIGVLTELTVHLLRPAKRWIRDSLLSMVSLTVLGLAIALLLTFWVNPIRYHSALTWQYRANFFTSILTCELFTAILLTSQRLGVYWRSHLMGIGAGLTIWALICFLVDGLHTYWGAQIHFDALENTRKIAYLGTLAFWITNLWRNEPERNPIPREMHDAILRQADRLSYDLAEVLGTQEEELH
jgi:hypothetical protein